jgi:hypothetical protein
MAKGGGTDAEALKAAEDFRDLVLKVIPEKKAVIAANLEMTRDYKPDPNEATAQLPGDLMQFELFQYKQLMVQKVMDTNHFYVWLDMVQGEDDQSYVKKDGIFEFKGQNLLRFLSAEEKAKLDATQAEITTLTKAMPPEYPYLMGLKDDPNPKNIKLNLRGNAHALGEEVPRGFPAILGKTDGDPLPFTKGSGRLELADAIIQTPLAARVMVNRIWQHHFGEGIVRTPSNFGKMGEQPSHPELLDWLALEFIRRGWSVKAMHRLMMNSEAYQMSSTDDPKNVAIDSENRLFWRMPRERLEAEAIRDGILAVAGTLDRTTGGPCVFPYISPDLFQSSTHRTWPGKSDDDPSTWRRSIYVFSKRSIRYPMFEAYDQPNLINTCDRRNRSTIAPQALLLMNNNFVLTQAKHFAERLKKEAGSDPGAQAERGFLLALGRAPSAAERTSSAQYIRGGPDRLAQFCQALFNLNEFVYRP